MRRPTRARATARSRPAYLKVDRLEDRQMLSTAQVVGPQPITAIDSQTSHPMYDIGSLATNTPPSGAFTPSEIAQAYGFNAISFGSAKGDGSGETIAIVDAYSDPNLQSDLNTFDGAFNLPATTVSQVNETGGSSLPAADSSGGWETEESLDVEWAHAMAPGARIILVAASSTNDTDLLAGVKYAASVANVVSMSWGGSEFSGETSYDGDFSKAGVAFVASSGDQGAPIDWPAASPNVLAVGGTSLSVSSGSSYGSESGWSGSGGGPSAYESQPTYQSGVVTQTTKRANPDVAYDADPNTGFAVYDSYGSTGGWMQVGGTSAGAPQWAALLAIADQGRSLAGEASLDSTGAQQVQTTLYANARTGDFHDVTSGTSTGSPNYSAGTGYDFVTGIGTPVANLVVGSLVGSTTTAPAIDQLTVSSPTSTTAGSSFNVTVTATANGATDAGYTGTVSLAGTINGTTTSLGSHTFTASDGGKYTFAVTLDTAGTESIAATGGANSPASSVTISPAAASKFLISGLSSTATAGAGQTFTVTAYDPYGNVATTYAGTVGLTSSDTSATFVDTTGFSQGKDSFGVTFGKAGSQSVTVTDKGNASLTATQSGIVVSPVAPTSLSATAASASQINLSWTGSAGASGYTVLRGTSANGPWTTVATVTSGTTYQDTGLTSGTTYYYEVKATGGNGSGASNVASAATTGTAPVATSETVFGNATPSIAGYIAGSYDVGMEFTSSVAGNVTGARFYQQSFMAGYAHVGYLWSSNGTLLASATFASQSGTGWEQVTFSNPVAIAANTTYIVSFSTGGGYDGVSTGAFSSPVTSGNLTAPTTNGVYGVGNTAFPRYTDSGLNFWADVVFSPSATSSVATTSTAKTSISTMTTGYTTTTGTTRRSTAYAVPAASPAPASTVRASVATVVPQAKTAVLFSSRKFLGA